MNQSRCLKASWKLSRCCRGGGCSCSTWIRQWWWPQVRSSGKERTAKCCNKNMKTTRWNSVVNSILAKATTTTQQRIEGSWYQLIERIEKCELKKRIFAREKRERGLRRVKAFYTCTELKRYNVDIVDNNVLREKEYIFWLDIRTYFIERKQ